MNIITLVTGIIIGTLIGWLLAKFTGKKEDLVPAEKLDSALQDVMQKSSELSESKALHHSAQNQVDKLEAEFREERQAHREIQSRYDTVKADYENLREKLQDQKSEFEQLQKKFTTEFQNLANAILEEKTKKFTEQNKEQLHQLLSPLGEKIKEFEKKVDAGNQQTLQWNTQLQEQLKNMRDLNVKITQEASNLTKALQGDVKKQGNWGEMILERILEQSGLRKDVEYKLEDSTTIDGKRLRPDVVIHLPDEKFLIIDSKLSLNSYEKWNSAEDVDEQAQAAKEFTLSLKAHIKGLAKKDYQSIHGMNSPNFILMFIPIESAFSLALRLDQSIYQQAFDHNIVIVSPSTLLATLSTVSNIWKHENQTRNAQEIAKRGGLLFDKFKGFVESLQEIGKHLDRSQKSYETAYNRLVDGPGNLIRQAEMLKEMGADTTQKLPDEVRGRD